MPDSIISFLTSSETYKLFALLAVVALVTAVPTVILVRFSRRFAPAFTHPKIASGVGGWLVLFLFGQVAWFLRGVWET